MMQSAAALQFLSTGLAVALASLVSGASSAAAGEAVLLAPHRASYDVGLGEGSDDLLGVDGRIAVDLSEPADCRGYGIAYRFVARFLKDQEAIVTDQQIRIDETRDGRHFRFDGQSFVDSLPDSTTSGEATTADGQTVVTFENPAPRDVTLPRSQFPVHHTRAIIAAAKAGRPIVETHVFQGDSDAEKNTTSTVIITPLDKAELASEIAGYGSTAKTGRATPPAAGAEAPGGDDLAPNDELADEPAGEENGSAQIDGSAEPQDGQPNADVSRSHDDADASEPAAIAAALKGLTAWRVTESFYNSDSDEDGLPVFETIYTLFENGVTGNQILKFDGYTLNARLASLELRGAPDCPLPAGE
ncbi:EipB family protein [Jiella mangrovi]|uniref:DUF1849 family protein n=1 Tax=Jiella mangrovi TaxID=2821407 RepID=A0ABS4BFB1_9HYPH|nr:DUF1849 family protein [Jiella mangrovi]MBP0615443.1 DUF1849 family protein [Jiella mangrovi]